MDKIYQWEVQFKAWIRATKKGKKGLSTPPKPGPHPVPTHMWNKNPEEFKKTYLLEDDELTDHYDLDNADPRQSRVSKVKDDQEKLKSRVSLDYQED